MPDFTWTRKMYCYLDPFVQITEYPIWPMRMSKKSEVLKRVLGGKSNKFTSSTSISDSQDPPRPFFIILSETGQWDSSGGLSFIFTDNKYVFSINIFYITQKILEIIAILSENCRKKLLTQAKNTPFLRVFFLWRKRIFELDCWIFDSKSPILAVYELVKNDDWSD